MTSRNFKILHVAESDINGGAARAAFRVHECLLDKNYSQDNSFSSYMRVINKFSNNDSVKGGIPNNNKFRYFCQKALNYFSRSIYTSSNKNTFSTAWPSTGLGNELNKLYLGKKIDIVTLHWLGNHCLSVKEIGNLKMPVTWRLADQWAFCGCEHYDEDFANQVRDQDELMYINGYKSKIKKSFDLNKINFSLKKKYWKKPITIIAPSKWIAKCAQKSDLFKNFPVSVIPTPLNLSKWAPIDRNFAREVLQLPQEKKLLLFGAVDAVSNTRKGGDLLIEAIKSLERNNYGIDRENIELVIFGQNKIPKNFDVNLRVHNAGFIDNDIVLRLYYSACDVFIIPSRQDNLPGTGLEAHACGTPVVGFNIGGIPEIIDHHVTGAIVKSFDAKSLSEEIAWVIKDELRLDYLSKAARSRAVELWNKEKISRMYFNLYLDVINRKQSNI